jgi:hypothetical protein
MSQQDLLRIESQLPDPTARFVVSVFRLFSNRESVPTLIAGGEGVTLLERCRLERSGGELRPRKATREDGELAIPVIGQRKLEFRVVWDDTVDVTMGDRRSTGTGSSRAI